MWKKNAKSVIFGQSCLVARWTKKIKKKIVKNLEIPQKISEIWFFFGLGFLTRKPRPGPRKTWDYMNIWPPTKDVCGKIFPSKLGQEFLLIGLYCARNNSISKVKFRKNILSQNFYFFSLSRKFYFDRKLLFVHKFHVLINNFLGINNFCTNFLHQIFCFFTPKCLLFLHQKFYFFYTNFFTTMFLFLHQFLF